jgi:alpha-methylacyl-CoA racemase
VKPLADLRVVEFATVGGVPFCAWWLAQQGANVTRIVNPKPSELGVPVAAEADLGAWARTTLPLDLKSHAGKALACEEILNADILIEGFRPGVMERLGLGPKDCHQFNPQLIFARVVGWDREGPWADRAGHDINYVAMTGVLHALGSNTVPINLIGDLAGGAQYAAMGILAGLHARTTSGKGCVVDVNMTDGVLHLLTAVFARLDVGAWHDSPAANVIDGGVPWYRTYQTADHRYIAVGAIEERFYHNFVRGLGLAPEALPPRSDATQHGLLAETFQRCFAARSMHAWAQHFSPLEACVTPVLSLGEARDDPTNHNAFLPRISDRLPRIPRAVPRLTPISEHL